MAYANNDDYKKWYAANRERLIAKARAADLANPEKAAQRKREYLERHPDKRKETNRRYMKKPEVITKIHRVADYRMIGLRTALATKPTDGVSDSGRLLQINLRNCLIPSD